MLKLNLNTHRKNAGLTQAQLAKMVGVTAMSIALYESGKNFPRLRVLYKLSVALGVPMEALLEVDDVDRCASSK